MEAEVIIEKAAITLAGIRKHRIGEFQVIGYSKRMEMGQPWKAL